MLRPSPVVKPALFGAGLGVGVAGMALEWPWLVWVAAGLLAAAFLARFVERKDHAP